MGQLNDLRPHQVKALDGLKEAIRAGKRRPVLQLPTGAGKTVIAAHIVHGAMAKGNRVAFIVPLLNLIDQTFERFTQNGIDPADIGVIQGDHEWRRPQAPVQICSVQTLARRGMPEANVYVVDEVHVRSDVLWRHLMSESAPQVAIGLSATPWTKGLGKVFDDLIRPISMQQLIDDGYLSKFRVFAPTHPDLTGIKTVAGDFHEGQLSERMSQPKIVADVVSTWLARANGAPTLLFAVDRAHAAKLHEEFERNGVVSTYVDANTPREERADLGKRFNAKEIQVICNIGTMTTGVDLDVRCIVYARPTRSESLYVQSIGRGLRTAPGKEECLILDHSDTTLSLGMVTDIDRAELCSGSKDKASEKEEKERKVPAPRECPSCACLVPVGHRECPACGREMKIISNVVTLDGELVELGGKKGKTKKPEPVLARLWDMGKQEVWSQILDEQINRGKQDGWASHLYKSIFGVWPRGLTKKRKPSSFELRGWIRSRNIAYAKSKAVKNG